MRATTVMLAALGLVASAAAAHYATELRSERASNAALRAQLAVLTAPGTRSAAAPPSSAPGGVAPSQAPAPVEPSSAPQTRKGGVFAAHPAMNAGVTYAIDAPDAPPEEQVRRMREQILAQRREHERRMREDPDYRTATLAQHVRNLRRIHAGVDAELGLSPAETDALYTLLAEDQLRTMHEAPLFMPGESPTAQDMEALQERRNARAAELEARLREHLGEARYAEWQEFQQNAPARWTARALRDELAYGANPLTAAQERHLAKAIAAEQVAEREWHERQQARFATRGSPVPPAEVAKSQEERVEQVEAANRRLHEAARGILDAEQLRRFDEMRAEELAMQRSAARAARAVPAEGPDPATGLTRVGAIPMPPTDR